MLRDDILVFVFCLLFFLVDVYSFIRIYSSFFFSLFSLAFSSESTCAAQSVGGKPSLSVARLMTCRAQSVRQHTNGQNRTVLNATKLRENHTSVSFLSPTPKFILENGKKKKKMWERMRGEREETKKKERYLFRSFVEPRASQSSPTDGEAKQLYLWMGGDSRLTGIICKLKSNEGSRELNKKKEKSFIAFEL